MFLVLKEGKKGAVGTESDDTQSAFKGLVA